MVTHNARGAKWYKTKICPCWSDFKTLPYTNEPFNDMASESRWKSLGFTQTRFTGDMYDMRNPSPDWMELVKINFPWQFFSWSLYRMIPGTVLPLHGDTYAKFRQVYQIDDPATIWRAIIFLEDWASGHYFEIDQTPVLNWQAGDTVVWQNATSHIAANIGHTDRYTLQITGVRHANSFIQ